MSTKQAYGIKDASYIEAGKEPGLRKLVDFFYAAMEKLPEAKKIRAMHEGDLTEIKNKLTLFLCGWLGGPKLFQEKYGPIRIPLAHRGFPIGAAERDAWLLCMQNALDKMPYPDEFKSYLMKQFAVPAERVRNLE